MTDKLKFSSKDNKIWFVSDLHWGHNRDFILKPRGYENITQSDSHILSSWNSTISNDDIVFNLGDFAFMDSDSSKTKFLINHLNCKRHYFLFGNHNSGVKQLYEDEMKKQYGVREVEIYPLHYNDRFTFLGHYAEIYVDGQAVVLAHYPIASWNGMGKGAYHLNGHCHMNMPDDPTLLRLDVGWDRLKRPISWTEVVQLMKKKTPKPVDHH